MYRQECAPECTRNTACSEGGIYDFRCGETRKRTRPNKSGHQYVRQGQQTRSQLPCLSGSYMDVQASRKTLVPKVKSISWSKFARKHPGFDFFSVETDTRSGSYFRSYFQCITHFPFFAGTLTYLSKYRWKLFRGIDCAPRLSM